MIRTPRTRKELNFSFDDEERIGKMTLTGEGALFSEFIVVGGGVFDIIYLNSDRIGIL
jgi:hypothetical protein